jgi:hypothetical protein
VLPQQVGTGNPNCGLENPSGMGAGVLCNFASFRAKERPVEGAAEESLRKSVARKKLGLFERGP